MTLKFVQLLENLFVVLKVCISSNYFEDIKIQGQNFLRNDDFWLLSSDLLMIHIC